ncbi:class III aminotransferase [Nemania sp. NC0429]|nr:class III aminotransferase [Nemania sp. NC0429]
MGSTATDRIESAYAEAERRYVATNPASREAHETAAASLPGGNTRSVLHWGPYPLCISSAEGYTLRDADGHAYVDLLGEYSAGLYGHSHPALLAAMAETARRGLSYGGPHAAEARLAALVLERFRGSVERVRFTNSGTEANLMALAAAKAFTGRHRGRVVVFEGAYHGGVLVFPFGCAGVFNNNNNNNNNNAPGRAATETGTDTRGPYEALRALNAPHDFLVAPYNDVASFEALIAPNEADGVGGAGDGISAILIEPMLGSGGGVRATPDFLSHLRRRADELGALLIFDEVMTSRMHDGGGIQGALGLRPDLTTLGKYVGGGMSFGAFGGRADVMALFDPRMPGALPHAGTFNNNVLTMNVGAAGLEGVFTAETARALHALGDEVRERINELSVAAGDDNDDDDDKAAKRGLRVLGCGSILVFHFTRARARDIVSPADFKRDEIPRLLDLFHLEMLREGFYLARRGYVALSIPLLEPEGRRDLDRFVDAVGRFVGRFREVIESE